MLAVALQLGSPSRRFVLSAAGLHPPQSHAYVLAVIEFTARHVVRQKGCICNIGLSLHGADQVRGSVMLCGSNGVAVRHLLLQLVSELRLTWMSLSGSLLSFSPCEFLTPFPGPSRGRSVRVTAGLLVSVLSLSPLPLPLAVCPAARLLCLSDCSSYRRFLFAALPGACRWSQMLE